MNKLDFAVLEAAHKTATGADLVPLHALDGPAIASLQEQIRQQHALIASMGKAIQYMLARIKTQPELMKLFSCTESHDRLVTALAQMMGEPRALISRRFGGLHDPREDYGCMDDPKPEAVL